MPELKPGFLIDTTMRDGEQAAGVVFSAMEKLGIAIALDNAGITWIEAGTPVMGQEEAEAMRLILNAGLKAVAFSWNRACHQDIAASVACGFEFLHISVPVSDLHIYHKLKRSRKWVYEQLTNAVSLAQSHGCRVSVGAEDASRAHPDQFLELAELSERLGAVRIRYADTVGLLDPFTTRNLMSHLAARCSLPIEFHAHNDFGLATANTVAALQSGALFASVTATGIGERAGNAALEEVLAVLEETDIIPEGTNLAAAKKIGCQVAAISSRRGFS
ncbi:homocitrate synthase [Sporomusa sp. KB1]|jgi:homocitrate synthase NifV|uniref:homocitrate synthase n=1 Tax=Sporomusa sp. KB1 TaxID=943346 RepID=UPI00119F4F21|nr:homocitrate synthase [Sporomusa sp. KB1]TWH46037.1 homocitrate synthase NifV [Sporomusa sp. KB1]